MCYCTNYSPFPPSHLHTLYAPLSPPCYPPPPPTTQRTCEIWAFAFSFAWRYFLVNQKWTYKKKEGGMTPAAVSKRKQELAGA